IRASGWPTSAAVPTTSTATRTDNIRITMFDPFNYGEQLFTEVTVPKIGEQMFTELHEPGHRGKPGAAQAADPAGAARRGAAPAGGPEPQQHQPPGGHAGRRDRAGRVLPALPRHGQ